MQTETIEIGGHHMVLTAMPFKESRKVANRLLRLSSVYDNDAARDSGLGYFLFAGLAGLFGDEDMDFFCEKFGACTMIVKPGTSDQLKFDSAMQDTVFRGNIELMYHWLDACSTFHFGNVLKNLAGAVKNEAKKNRANKSTPDVQS